MVLKELIPACLVLQFVFVPTLFAGLVHTINPDASTDPDVAISFGQPKIGWYFTAPVDYQLTRIESEFDSLPGTTPLSQLITIKLFTDRPALGGVVLSTGAFNSNNQGGGRQGADMTSFNIVGGHRYFLGFEGLTGTGVNVATWRDVNGLPTLSHGATTTLGAFYRGNDFENEFSEQFSLLAGGGRVNGAAPILFFNGTIAAVPEPSSFILLAATTAVPFGSRVYRRAKCLAAHK